MKGPPAIPSRHATLVHALAAAAGSEVGITFVDAREREELLPYAAVHRRAQLVAGGLAALGVAAGDRVALVLPTAPSFLDAFFGVLLAGAIPVPLYPPVRLGRLEEFHARTARLLERVGARLVLSDARIRRLLGVAVSRARPALGCRTADELPGAAPLERAPAPHQVAFIQYSSGTTVDPKPVALTHENVIAHLAALESYFPEVGPVRQGGVSWLPLYHDMGLVGCLLLAVYHPGPLTLIPPELFLARPAIWLRAISRARATVSPAPNFAYGLCVKRVRDAELAGVDLSTWRHALNGAEAIAPSVLDAFIERFAPFGFAPEALSPVYGLSEATLAVTFSDPRRRYRVAHVDRQQLAGEGRAVPGDRPVVSVGTPLPGLEVEVRGEHGEELAEDRVGRIHVRGPSVTPGYFGEPPGAELLDTGDLGFVRDGELFVCGRVRDVVILRGANHAPQEFEDCLTGVPGVRTGCAVALGVDRGEGEELVMLVETEGEPGAALVDAVRAAVVERTAIRPSEVHLLAPGTLPRTSSGKLRRAEARRQLLAGELRPPLSVNVVRIAGEVLRSTGRARPGAARLVTHDVVIAGAGPAGAALAIDLARRGLAVALLDRRRAPPDKACGEGILPAGARRLAQLGIHLEPADASAIRGIRYVQEDGSHVEACFASGAGLGVRRTALAAAFWERAAAAGADLRPGMEVQSLAADTSGVTVHTGSGTLRAGIAVAADGLHSRLRRAAGLELTAAGPRRVGVRRHFTLAPWTDLVEVHWAPGAEAYVTPAGSRRVGIAFLVQEGPARFDALLARFPLLQERLAGAPADSDERGAGPLLQMVSRRTAHRFALLGDAAGYVDAITGEGISLALACAADLAEAIPGALAGVAGLRAYEQAAAARFAAYERATRAVMVLSRRPLLRRTLLSAASRIPLLFRLALHAAVEAPPQYRKPISSEKSPSM